MLTLTVPIPVPNLTKIHVDSVQLDGVLNQALVALTVQGAGGVVYQHITLGVRDGVSDALRAKAAPLGYQDVLEVYALATPTGFTDLVTAYTGGIAARNKAAESALLAAGLLPAGAVA
jgi:hypothetical protein